MATDESLQFAIYEIDSKSQHLQTVIKLADAGSATLGFLPYGAFRRLADKGLVLACINPQIGCIGYLLYEASGYKVRLTHLCIDEEWRGKGIAKALIKVLKEKTKHLQGIQASCRRDYNLRGMWASLGFVAVHERPGRSKDGSILTEWWLDYGHPNLLTTLAQQTAQSRLCVAIDANIFYDIADEEAADEDSKESKALIADWLDSELELCLTDEIRNEIDRNKNSKKRKELRKTASQFTFLPCSQEEFDEACRSLRKFFPQVLTDSDASDLRQLARVISSNIKVSFFVTRDKRLLEELEEAIYKEFNLLIIHPIDLILRLDELRRETEYQPIRLAGTNIERRRVQSGEQDLLVDLFLNYSFGESKITFQRKLRQALSNLDRFECFTIGRREEAAIGLIVYDREDREELKIPVFRFRNTQFTPTILRHCIFESFSTAANESRNFTRITETNLSSQVTFALQEDSFLNTEEGWLRANLKILGSSYDISAYISQLCQRKVESYENFLALSNILASSDIVGNVKLAADMERILYPAKIADTEIPTFVIPIQPWWAKDLFDKEVAEGFFWAANENIALSREVVYYRSKQASGGLQAPGRILWYVSNSKDDNSYSVLGAIRACSRLDEIVIGKPKELYKRFRRLGVYTFQNVLKTAREDLNREIMAIKFSDTELFKKPVKLRDVEQILGRKISVRAPYKLSSRDFAILYNEGISLASEK